MSIQIHTKFSKPAQLLGGSPKATLWNMVVVTLFFIWFDELIACFLFCILQAIVCWLTYKNPFFVEELFVNFSCKDSKSIIKKGVQSYV